MSETSPELPPEGDLHDEDGFPPELEPSDEDAPSPTGRRGEGAERFTAAAEARPVSREVERS